MVGALKKWLGIDVLEKENLRLARAILALEKQTEEDLAELERRAKSEDARIREDTIPALGDHEARITFCESQLTAKTSAAKIVPKAKPTTWKQFASAAERASEDEQEQPNG